MLKKAPEASVQQGFHCSCFARNENLAIMCGFFIVNLFLVPFRFSLKEVLLRFLLHRQLDYVYVLFFSNVSIEQMYLSQFHNKDQKFSLMNSQKDFVSKNDENTNK